ncbi:PKD domain-containing protein [Maribellus comscasis]|uniref:PKD domain-containing protein n=1 Tax=Maribellus comscasis TaxID=2681766 RepID=A0A6I6K059_9BACT|nr:PKD domain-containing protein [Maribellus comscasis]QGY44773.1 PKD domain-containing protein [Maribellus comscasis]
MKKLVATHKLVFFAFLITMLVSCEEEDELPLFEFYGILDEYELTTKVKSENVDTYLWDFGDGNTSAEMEPVHTYGSGGEYTVTLTVTGPGGEKTKEKSFEVAIPIEELLAGGPGNTEGKTWLLSTGYTVGSDGSGSVGDDLKIENSSVEEVLRYFGLKDEYEDEYTFYPDGTYKIDSKNGLILAGILFGSATGTVAVPSSDLSTVPLCSSTYTPPTSGTWSLDYDDYTVDVFNVFTGASAPEEVTFTFNESDNKVARLVFSEGQFIGFLDLSPLFIIKEISANEINMAIGLNVVEQLPYHTSLMIHFTFTPK